MEIFLNIVWLCVSAALLGRWVRAVRKGESRLEWSTVVAVGLLLLLLFPVISMTDDLVAMNTPGEVEHILRRHDAPLQALSADVLFGGIALCMLSLVVFLCRMTISRIRRRSFAARLLAGYVRASGVRPPPATFRTSLPRILRITSA